MSNTVIGSQIKEVTATGEIEGIMYLEALTLAPDGGSGTAVVTARFEPGQTKVTIATINCPSDQTVSIPFYCVGIRDLEVTTLTTSKLYVHAK